MKESNESIPCIVQLVQEAPFPTDPMVIEAANCCCFSPFRSVTSRFCGLPSQRISLLGTESQQRLHGHAGTRDPAPRTDLSGLHLVHLPLHPPPAAAWAVPILCSTVQWCQAFFIFHGGTSWALQQLKANGIVVSCCRHHLLVFFGIRWAKFQDQLNLYSCRGKNLMIWDLSSITWMKKSLSKPGDAKPSCQGSLHCLGSFALHNSGVKHGSCLTRG